MNRCLPSRFKGKLDQDQVESINSALTDPETQDMLKENILGFSNVLAAPHYSLKDYVNAVKYISFKMMGDTNIVAWSKVFPDRYTRLVARGTLEKDIHAHVRHYNRTKLVNEIREQSLIPTHIINADVFQEAINTQAKLMRDEDVSPKVRCEAANSLLTHLKRPEAQKIELDVGLKENSMLTELKDVTTALAAQQLAMIESGAYSPKEIAHQEILVNPEKEIPNA